MTKRIESPENAPEEFAKNMGKIMQSKMFWLQIGIGITIGFLLMSPAIFIFVLGIFIIAFLQALYKPVDKFFHAMNDTIKKKES